MVCFSYEMHSLTTDFRNAGLKDSSYAGQHSVAVKTTIARESTSAVNVDDDNVVFECEGSLATRLLGTVRVRIIF